MDKLALTARTIAKSALEMEKAITSLEDKRKKFPDDTQKHIDVLEEIYKKYSSMYRVALIKEKEKNPTLVYQMFGKKTTELTPEEFRQYKAKLKRIRESNRRKSLAES